jgi:hypothetical protein
MFENEYMALELHRIRLNKFEHTYRTVRHGEIKKAVAEFKKRKKTKKQESDRTTRG